MRVGIDLDGVCYDFAEAFVRYLRYSGNTDYDIVDGEPDKWYFYKDWGMSTQSFLQHCHDGADAGIIFGEGGQRDNASRAVNRISRHGHSIHIITDRSFGTTPAVSEKNTRLWLDQNGFVYDTIDFSADKTCRKTDVFIEDKLENYDALVEAGVDCYLVNRPWNTKRDKRKRVFDIEHFADLILNKPI